MSNKSKWNLFFQKEIHKLRPKEEVKISKTRRDGPFVFACYSHIWTRTEREKMKMKEKNK